MPNRTLTDQLEENRRWVIRHSLILICVLVAVVLLGVFQLVAVYGNRAYGSGNRTVSCTILNRVDPTSQVAECATRALRR